MVCNSAIAIKDIVLDHDGDNKTEIDSGDFNLHQGNFKSIDRNEEDDLVNAYQKTNNMETLNKLYEIRKQTLQIWAKKYAYLRMSEEDLLSDITMIWQKCVQQYEYKPQKRTVRTKNGKIVTNNGKRKTIFKRTPFNTFLYTSLRNYMSNISKRQHSKKRIDDFGRPQESHLMSLDYEYDTNKGDAKKICLRDTLVSHEPGTESKYSTDTMIDEISKGDQDIKDALRRFVSDSHVKKISNACQNIVEQIQVSKQDAEIFNGHKGIAKKRLKNIINDSNKYSKGYKLLNFRFDNINKIVTFEVKRKDTRVLRKTTHALEKYKEKLLASQKPAISKPSSWVFDNSCQQDQRTTSKISLVGGKIMGFRSNSHYGILVREGSRAYVLRDDLINKVANLTGRSKKLVLFDYYVISLPSHKSNNGRTKVDSTSVAGKIKIIPA